jgi:hypothetical protein
MHLIDTIAIGSQFYYYTNKNIKENQNTIYNNGSVHGLQ